MGAAIASNAAGPRAVANMIVLAFFFLLRPGECTGTTTDNAPFRLADVMLHIGRRQLDLTTSTEAELLAATSVSLVFATQKNGVRGEVANHGRSGAAHACPVRAVVHQVLHLRAHNAPLTTPLAACHRGTCRCAVTAADITDALRASAGAIGADLGLTRPDISARSLRAGGAMAPLCAQVDSDIIRLLGRWQSDAMMRHLHVQAQPVMRGLAAAMLRGGDCAVFPGETVPMH